MDQEFLLRFLEIGAIDLKGDDTKLGKLRSTAKDLSAALRKTPSKTASFTMVAADPNIAPTDPIVEEVMTSLRTQWETVANAFSGRPVGVLRAILLDAIVQAARSDDAIAVGFVNTARNAVAHAETANEAQIWREAVSEIETKVDARAETEWATPEMITVDPLQYMPPASVATAYEAPTVDRSALQADIYSAAGPWGPNSPNQYHASQPQQWSKEFADKMSVTIADALDGMAEHLASAQVDLSGPLSGVSVFLCVRPRRLIHGAARRSFSRARACGAVGKSVSILPHSFYKSVVVKNRKLVHRCFPVVTTLAPSRRDVAQSQPDQFGGGVIIGEMPARLDDFA